MNARLIAALLILAAVPPGYAAFVYGWQLVSFSTLAVRLDDGLPGETWVQIGLCAAQMAIIAAALLVGGQGLGQRRYRKSLVALAVAWLAGGPLFVLLLRL